MFKKLNYQNFGISKLILINNRKFFYIIDKSFINKVYAKLLTYIQIGIHFNLYNFIKKLLHFLKVCSL